MNAQPSIGGVGCVTVRNADDTGPPLDLDPAEERARLMPCHRTIAVTLDLGVEASATTASFSTALYSRLNGSSPSHNFFELRPDQGLAPSRGELKGIVATLILRPGAMKTGEARDPFGKFADGYPQRPGYRGVL